MTYTQAQFDRLPKWAQQVLRDAERETTEAVYLTDEARNFEQATQEDAALAVLNGPGRWDWRGDIVAVRDPYDANPVPVARARDHIRFYLTNEHDHHEWIDFSLRGGGVQVTGDRGLLIRSRSGNSIEVFLDER